MRKIISIITIAVLILSGGCIKNRLVVWTGAKAELDATTWNTNAAGLTYPILTRVPGYGRAVGTFDSTIRRYPQTIRIRVNLVGPQSKKNETVGYELFSTPVTTFTMPATASCSVAQNCNPAWTQTPAAPSAVLAISDASQGVHFAALSGSVTIPANSSFGYIDLVILNPGPTAGAGRFIGIKLNNNGTIPASVNYSQLGLIIDQR